MLVLVGTASADLTPGKSYRLLSGQRGRTHSMFVKDASLDVNSDGRIDVISGDWFSKETWWIENLLPSTSNLPFSKSIVLPP